MSDDWETDPDFVNDVTEKEQRWGSKTVGGSGHQGSIDLRALREEVKQSDKINKLKTAPKPSYGYGGKFGVERDRMDKSAVGHDHIEHVPKHASQTDYSTGFGGKYGVQTDRQDRSAVGWDHKEQIEAHASQKDYASGFGGKYGVQKDRQDKSAVGWDHKEQVAPHPSQKDYAFGFGGKYGVQTDRVDSTSASWDEKSSTELHPSQMRPTVAGTAGGLSALRDRFESKGKVVTPAPNAPSAAQQRVLEERARWEAERKKAAENQEDQLQPVGEQPKFANTAAQSIAPEPKSSAPIPNGSSNVRPVPPAPVQPSIEPSPTPPPSTAEPVTSSAPEPAPVPSCGVEPIYYTAKALYDYTAEEDDELTFSVGELITEIEKIDPGWWKGLCRGKIGLFPANMWKNSNLNGF
ncbi:Src substrate cortactin [Fasciola gigantica]|uniref:Src substrate cortactin n=1 Tax=Fasciola gigantica TaxID=46835 RepID=A0A504YEQ5_FASGI|nr:Src substrate cortactin [Fasciola gigantica]